MKKKKPQKRIFLQNHISPKVFDLKSDADKVRLKVIKILG